MMITFTTSSTIAMAAPSGQFSSVRNSSYTTVATIFRRRPPSNAGIANELADRPNTIRLPDRMPGIACGSTMRVSV
ncbi:hypothetical protein G6F63_016433 [Rhizopus arrhizus]|nr:hypothetical protein G6F63_016433 [Rhizopus arrhizus]